LASKDYPINVYKKRPFPLLFSQGLKKYVPSKEIFLLFPLLVFLFGFYLFPVAKILFRSVYDNGFTLEHIYRMVTVPLYFKVLLKTIKISLIVTVLSCFMGYPVAYLFFNIKERTRDLLLIVVLIPFWVSILVRTYGWMVILGRHGLLNSILLNLGIISSPIKLLYNEPAVYVGMIQIMIPFMILPIYSVMSKIDKNLLKAGEILGATPASVFWRIFFPLSLPGVLTGSILVFLLSTGFFITPALMGGRKEIMIAVLIAEQVDVLLNWSFAAALSLLLLVITIGTLGIFNKLFGLDRIIRQI
jgi:putative spermidine/putrescine transport system permease protein